MYKSNDSDSCMYDLPTSTTATNIPHRNARTRPILAVRSMRRPVMMGRGRYRIARSDRMLIGDEARNRVTESMHLPSWSQFQAADIGRHC